MFLINEIQFIDRSDSYIMVNLITGAADIIDTHVYDELISNTFNLDNDIISLLLQRHYIFHSYDEYKHFVNEIDNRICMLEEKSVPNFVLIPSYACNLSCTYCYEQTYKMDKNIIFNNPYEIIDKQFEFIDNILSSSIYDKTQDVRITIMGGEPLLYNQFGIIKYIIDVSKAKGFTVDIVTNGVELDKFLSILKSTVVDHIQVTLDGIKEVHDKRRIFRDKSGSFEKIFKNIQLALNENIKTYLRVNLDVENIGTIHLLAKSLQELSNVNNLFPYIYLLQDGGCSGDSNVIMELSGIEQLSEIEKKYPEVAIFYKRYHPMQFIDSILKNQKFMPCSKHCGASKNQYILDCKGYIYKCWHGIGNREYSCGSYYPKIYFNDKFNKWKNRSTLYLSKCNDCKYRYICGTGCPAAQHKGIGCFDIEKESCVDYEGLIEILFNKLMDF